MFHWPNPADSLIDQKPELQLLLIFHVTNSSPLHFWQNDLETGAKVVLPALNFTTSLFLLRCFGAGKESLK